MPCTGKSKGHQRLTFCFHSLHNAFSFLFLHLCTGARMHGRSAAGCMRAPRAVCVVVTDRRGGGCTLLSGIALILLNDYWLRPEREKHGEHAGRCLTPPPPSTKHTQHLCIVHFTGKLGLDPCPLIDSKSIIPLICTRTKAIPLNHSSPFPGRK